jgi:hypothetical protein
MRTVSEARDYGRYRSMIHWFFCSSTEISNKIVVRTYKETEMRKLMLAVLSALIVATAEGQTKPPVAEAAKGTASKSAATAAEAAKPVAATGTPNLEALAGDYRFKSGLDMNVAKNGNTLLVKSTGQPPQILTASSEGKFNYAQIPAYITFDLDPKGVAKTLHFHYDDKSLPANRIDAALAKKASDALELKITNQTHDPACERTLRRLIEEGRAGTPDYSKMTLTLAQATKMQLPMIQSKFQQLGAVKEVKFTSVAPTGAEMFDVTFDSGTMQSMIFCLPNGFISGVGFR